MKSLQVDNINNINRQFNLRKQSIEDINSLIDENSSKLKVTYILSIFVQC